MPIGERAIRAVERHPAVRDVRLVGSRAEGRANAHSDWDFVVETDDFAAVAPAMAKLCEPLAPLAQQRDRLSDTFCWMVIVPGPHKLDFIFAEPHEHEPPWRPAADNLVALDAHFWDWALWLSSKVAAQKTELVGEELAKLFTHVLAPVGLETAPQSLDDAVASYVAARDQLERVLGVDVPRDLEREVRPVVVSP
jgi:predicted nucleotidyltransferase